MKIMCIYKIIVKFVSVLLCFIMIFSTAFIPKVYAMPLVSSVFSFIGDNIFNNSMETIGLTLVDMSKTTESEKDDKVASMINLWIFGGSTTETLNNITAICQDVLDLVAEIDTKIDVYQTDVNKILGEDKIDTFNTNLNDKWQNDVVAIEDNNYVDIALSKYKKYLNSAENYVNNKISLEELTAEKEELVMAFTKIYSMSNGGFDSDCDTSEQRKEIIYNNSTVADEISSTIERLCLKLSGDYTYSDSAAQFAYVAFPYAHMQYQYVDTAMLKQISEILLLQMMYQEYLSLKSEFFDDNYFNNNYENEQTKRDNLAFCIDEFNTLNENVAEDIFNYYQRDLHVSVTDNLTLNLNDYVKPEDIGSVTLKNTQYKGEYKNYNKTYFDNKYKTEKTLTLKPKYYSDTVNYNKIATVNSNGMNTYYVLNDLNSANMSLNAMLSQENHTIVTQGYYTATHKKYHSTFVSADYLNLTKCNYTDGENTYKSINNSQDLNALFDNNYFKAINSNPKAFLSSVITYSGNNNLYLVDGNLNTDFDASFNYNYTVNTYVDYYNLSASQPSLPMKTETYNSEESFEKSYNKNDMYTVVLKNQDKNNEHKYKLDLNITGLGDAEFYIDTVNDTKTDSNTTSIVTNPADKVEIMFKPVDNNKVKSLSLINTDTNKVVSTLSCEDIKESLKVDENGYYKISYNSSYSNYRIDLEMEKTYKAEFKSITGVEANSITFKEDIEQNSILKDTKVDFTARQDITEVYLNTIDEEHKIELTRQDNNTTVGSFIMPSSDVTLIYKTSLSPLSKDKDDFYLIDTFGDVESAITIYNNAIVKDHNFRLASDIIAPDNSMLSASFGEDEAFNGVFDGNLHKISNLTLSPQITALFTNLTGTVKDLEIESNIVVDSYKDEVKSNYSGLVDYAQNATIENIDVDVTMDINGYLSTSTYVGGIVSRAFDSTISNCTVNGEMSINNFSTIFIGGIAGTTENTDITNCINNANISNYYVKTVNGGGVVGEDDNSTIENVLNNANISNSFIIENSNIGGVCGISVESVIENSQNKGDITLDRTQTINIGGIVGVGLATAFQSDINDGNITATSNDDYYIDSIGGIAGMSTAPLMTVGCINNAKLSSDSIILYIGGILGKGQSTIIDSKNQGIIETLTITQENQGYTYINSSDTIGYKN